MKKRYKIVLNVEVKDPDRHFPADGDYTSLNRIEGIAHACTHVWTGGLWTEAFAKITLDKIVDKGEVHDATDTARKA